MRGSLNKMSGISSGLDGSLLDWWRCWNSHDGNAGAVEDELWSLSLKVLGVELLHNLWAGQVLETVQHLREAEIFRCWPFAEVVNDTQNHCALFFQQVTQWLRRVRESQVPVLEPCWERFRQFWGLSLSQRFRPVVAVHHSHCCGPFLVQQMFVDHLETCATWVHSLSGADNWCCAHAACGGCELWQIEPQRFLVVDQIHDELFLPRPDLSGGFFHLTVSPPCSCLLCAACELHQNGEQGSSIIFQMEKPGVQCVFLQLLSGYSSVGIALHQADGGEGQILHV